MGYGRSAPSVILVVDILRYYRAGDRGQLRKTNSSLQFFVSKFHYSKVNIMTGRQVGRKIANHCQSTTRQTSEGFGKKVNIIAGILSVSQFSAFQ